MASTYQYRPRFMIRLLRISLISLLLVAALFFNWVLNTEPGLKWSYQQIKSKLPATLSISEISGSLTGPLFLTNIKFEDQDQSLYAREITLNWDIWRLLQAEIYISNLSVQLLDIKIAVDANANENKNQPISLPLGIHLHNAEINTVNIIRGQDNYSFDQVSASASMRDQAINIESFDLSNETLRFNLQGALKPNGFYQHDLKLKWQTTLPSGANLEGQGTLSGDMKSTRLLQKVKGSLVLELKLELHDLLTQPTWQSTLEASAFDTRLLDAQLPPLKGRLKLNAKGDAEVASISGQLNAVSLLPDWPGYIEAHFTGNGGIENNELLASLNISKLNGTLRDYPVALQSQLQWKNNGINVSQLLFSSGETNLNAEGRISDTLKLRWSVDSNNLAELYPQAEGFLKASGELIGPRESPTLKALFNGKSLRLPGYAVDELQGELAVDLLKPEQSDIQLTAQMVNLQGQQLQSLDITADPNNIRASLSSEIANAQIALQGSIQADNWVGNMVQADIQSRDYQNWKLKSPVAVKLSRQFLLTDAICLLGKQTSEICSSINGQNDLWKIAVDANQLSLLMLRNWTPTEFHVEGRANVSADLEYYSSGQLLGKADFNLTPGIATYKLSNQYLEQFDYRSGRLEVDLQETGINANTRLELTNGDHFEGRIELPGANLFSFDYSKQSFLANASLNTKKLGIVDAMITQIDNLLGAVALDIEVSGTLSNPRVTGSAQLVDTSLNLPQINHSLTQINLDARSNGHQKVIYQGEAFTAGGKITLEGDTLLKAADGWPGNIRLEGASLDITTLLKPWLPVETKIEGALNTNASLKFIAPDNLTGEIEFSSPPGTVSYPLIEGEFESWAYRDSSLKLKIDQQGIRGHAELSIGDDNRLDSNLYLPQAKLFNLNWETQALEAEGKLIFNELAIIEALVPDIDHLSGTMTIFMKAGGVLAKPTLSMRAEILNAALRIPRLSLKLDQINLRGASDNQNQFVFQLDGRSGDGAVEIKGSSKLDASAGWPTRFEIKGENFEIASIPEAVVNVSPDLIVAVRGRNIDIRGDLHVPYAKLQPKDITTAAQVSDDTVIIDSTDKPTPKWQITTSVNVILGERVNFFGFGFEGQLGGKLLIEEASGQLTRGIGEINIPQGRYRAYGQRLDIDSGRLLFTGGPVTNPGLDIRAIRKINNIKAGIHARGTLKAPQLELFSIPAMGQTDTLSYILLGRPTETASGEDGNMMAKAALALGLVGGDRIARTMGDRFGLDEIRVESNDNGDQASLVLGQYLSPRLYVSYGVGLIESFNTLNLRYQIADQWQLKTESGLNQGADIFYTIER